MRPANIPARYDGSSNVNVIPARFAVVVFPDVVMYSVFG
jgi:hypothetical protein